MNELKAGIKVFGWILIFITFGYIGAKINIKLHWEPLFKSLEKHLKDTYEG